MIVADKKFLRLIKYKLKNNIVSFKYDFTL